MSINIFLAGVIQGSQTGKDICDQEYRPRLKALLEKTLDDVHVYCPVEKHPNSVEYDETLAEAVFIKHIEMASEADVVIAYLPEASMGTAIEIWEAFNRARTIFTISSLSENWVIKLLSTRNFIDLAEFEAFVTSGELEQFLDQRSGNQ